MQGERARDDEILARALGIKANPFERVLRRFSKFADRHGFWGNGRRYPPRDAETTRFCSQLSW